MKKHTLWHPIYTVTPATATALMQIEADRTVVEQTPLPLAVREELSPCPQPAAAEAHIRQGRRGEY
jgi:hypothetical protein